MTEDVQEIIAARNYAQQKKSKSKFIGGFWGWSAVIVGVITSLFVSGLISSAIGTSSGIPFMFVFIFVFPIALINSLWMFLPFIVFGIKNQLDRIIEELENGNVWEK